jgi:hypothetical protein
MRARGAGTNQRSAVLVPLPIIIIIIIESLRIVGI